MSKKTKKIKVSFLGEAANDVTGSMILVESSQRKMLIECGLYQSCKSTNENYRINNAKFDFKSQQIDYVFLPHLHADHSCRMPLLFKRGGSPRIIGVKDTKNMLRILLEDSARIMQSDVMEMEKKSGKVYSPIYTQDDVEDCLEHYEEYPIGEVIQLDDFVKFQYIPSGHIVNSAQLILWVKEDTLTKKIVYTSDLGNIHVEKYYTNKLQEETKCDLFISESTYAGTQRIASAKAHETDLEKLLTCARQTCIENKARMMLPVFAMDRCQNMLTIIYNLLHNLPEFDNVPVYVDSPMATRMCNEYIAVLAEREDDTELRLWQDVMAWKNLYFISSSEESKGIRDSHRPCIVLSSSGMIINRGRSAGWACSMLPRVNDRIVFCGYSAEGSIGAIIKEGKQKTITISGKKCPNKCQVTNLTTFTSHIQRDSLLDYLGKVNAQKIVLVHGDMDGRIDFLDHLKYRLSENNLTTRAVVAQKGYEISI